MVKVKICGITNTEDALASVDAGCDALGFVFYKKSPRYILPAQAKKIINALPKGVVKIGVFVNSKEEEIRRTAKLCDLNMIQLHGKESPGFCNRLKDFKVIKAFRINDNVNLGKIPRYNTYAYLFDTFVKSKIGGTGRIFDWRLVRNLKNIKQPIFLSGGLTEKNVLKAIAYLKPAWVDVSSSVEIEPGKKDQYKVRKFIKAAKGG
jgi:phosphoribosylanthranilate isomerase